MSTTTVEHFDKLFGYTKITAYRFLWHGDQTWADVCYAFFAKNRLEPEKQGKLWVHHQQRDPLLRDGVMIGGKQSFVSERHSITLAQLCNAAIYEPADDEARAWIAELAIAAHARADDRPRDIDDKMMGFAYIYGWNPR